MAGPNCSDLLEGTLWLFNVTQHEHRLAIWKIIIIFTGKSKTMIQMVNLEYGKSSCFFQNHVFLDLKSSSTLGLFNVAMGNHYFNR